MTIRGTVEHKVEAPTPAPQAAAKLNTRAAAAAPAHTSASENPQNEKELEELRNLKKELQELKNLKNNGMEEDADPQVEEGFDAKDPNAASIPTQAPYIPGYDSNGEPTQNPNANDPNGQQPLVR